MGEYLPFAAQQCFKCEPGTYSRGAAITFDHFATYGPGAGRSGRTDAAGR